MIRYSTAIKFCVVVIILIILAWHYSAHATQVPNKFIQNSLALKAFVEDQKASGTNAGACNAVSAGTWFQRNLNALTANNTGITLSSNQLSIPAGTWEVDFNVPGFASLNRFIARIYNVTNSAMLCQSTSASSDVAVTDYAKISCRFTLSGTKTVEIDMNVQTAAANTDCLGRASCLVALTGMCDFERYTQGTILKISP